MTSKEFGEWLSRINPFPIMNAHRMQVVVNPFRPTVRRPG